MVYLSGPNTAREKRVKKVEILLEDERWELNWIHLQNLRHRQE